MTGDSLDPAVDATTLIEQLRNGDRDVLDDALNVTATEVVQAIEAANVVENGKEVTLHFAPIRRTDRPRSRQSKRSISTPPIAATSTPTNSVFHSVEARDDLIMNDQQPPGSPDASATDGTSTETADAHEQDHDCQQHLEYVDYEWVDSCYDDLYVCGVCEKEFRMVYLKAFLLADEDFLLIEEYTDEIEDQLEQHLNHDATGQNGVEESADV